MWKRLKICIAHKCQANNYISLTFAHKFLQTNIKVCVDFTCQAKLKANLSPVYTTDNFRHGSCEIGTGA